MSSELGYFFLICSLFLCVSHSEWYNMDAGHDFEDGDPFGMDAREAAREEVIKKQKAQQGMKKISAQRRQLNEDQERWERDRMLTSGAVQRVGPSEDIEDEEEDKVQLLTHHVVPPFLDGRITFTKQVCVCVDRENG